MKTYLDCIPCFFKQALDSAGRAKASERQKKQIVEAVAKALVDFPLDACPPEMGRIIYGAVKRITRNKDPYKKVKEKSNRFALQCYPLLRNKVSRAADSLLMAVELAIAGNIIDYGAKNSLDVDTEFKRILSEENKIIKNEKKSLFRYTEFKRALRKAQTILYLADNAGEIVFDKILLQEIRRLDKRKKIIVAVKKEPIINDALREDAIACGIDTIASIIDNGLDAPGTIMRLCSKQFKHFFKSADMIISKGQGNFESLSKEKGPIFFLFMAKCPVVAKDVGCTIRDIILLKGTKCR